MLIVAILFLSGTFAGETPQRNFVSSDFSEINAVPVVQKDSLSGPMTSNPNINNQHIYVTVDCHVLPPDSTSSQMKVFVPDIDLTDSMPIYKPQILDEGIFMNKGECFKTIPQN